MRYIFFILAMILIQYPANAQLLPGQIKNRAVCDSIKSLEKHIAALPYPEALAELKRNPETPGCFWLEGKGALTKQEIGDPLGWLYAGTYIMSVHNLTLQSGRGVVHASIVKERTEWRLEDDCDVNAWKVALSTGEGYRFFGRDRKSMKAHCLSLVNRKAEADELNKPVVVLSDHWQSRPEDRQMNVCTSIDSTADGLDRVINEQQINNNDDNIFKGIPDCYQETVEKIVASRFVGLYPSNRGYEGKQFWFEIHQVAYFDKRTGSTAIAFMPTRPVRSKFFRLDEECQNSTVSLRGRRSVVLFGAEYSSIPLSTIPAAGGQVKLAPQRGTASGIAECRMGRTWSR